MSLSEPSFAPPMALAEQAALVLFPRIGSNLPSNPVTVEEDAPRVEALLERCPVGGLVLFNGDVETTPAVLQRLSHKRPGLLVASDIERGVGQQVRGATVFPHAMAYSALGDEAEALLRESARATAREARACGLHITFNPVADVNSNPRNPIIATRAFGTDPQTVSRLVRAYVEGCREGGLCTTAKHFPGHGDTSQDSHAELPVVPRDRDALEATELPPFRAAIEAGAELVMTAHVAFPALDDSGRPATLSRPILHGLLREELGFEGLVITDSLLMGGIRETHADPVAQAVDLLAAGVDVLLDVEDPEAIQQGLIAAVRDGRLDAGRLAEAAERVRALSRHGTAPVEVAPDVVGHPEHRALAERVARKAVTVLEARDGALPVPRDAGEGLLVIGLKPHRTRHDAPEEPLGEAVRTAVPGARYHQVDPDATDLAALEEAARGAEHVVVAGIVKPAAWHAFGLTDAQQAFVERLTAQRDVLLASLGSPVFLEAFPEAAARLCTYSDVPVAQHALVARLLGG